ncbi:MAG: hypothetical protein FWG03_07565 [Clostridiales bacterium]|nr:hypothetical protein [Clostridiales bacterium]
MKIFKTTTEAVLAGKKRKKAEIALIVPLLIASLVLTMMLSTQTGVTAEAPQQAYETPLASESGMDGPEIEVPGIDGPGEEDAPGEDIEASPADEEDTLEAPAEGGAGAPIEIEEIENPEQGAGAPDTPAEKDGPGPGTRPASPLARAAEADPGISVVIAGTKNVTGNKAPKKTFTFTLTQVKNGQGEVLSAMPVISPNPMSQQVETDGKGEYGFAFTITGLKPNDYYFVLKEQPEGGDWNYETREHLFKVSINNNGVPTVQYHSRKKPSDSWPILGWIDYSSGTTVGATVSEDIGMPYYDLNPNDSFLFLDDNFKPGVAGGFGEYGGTFLLEDVDTGGFYYPLCADIHTEWPKSDEGFTYREHRDDSESALFFAMRVGPNNLGLPGLPLDYFFRFFGIEPSTIMPPEIRVDLMQCILWAYEADHYSNPSLNLNDPLSWTSVSGMGDVFGYIFDQNENLRPLPSKADIVNAFKMIVKNTDGIMAQYHEGKTTSLSSVYTATDARNGALTFSYDGYVPTDSNGNETSYVTLSWKSDKVAVTATRDGKTVNLKSGDRVYTTDIINIKNTATLINNGVPVQFTLEDKSVYLKAGSLKGDILKPTDPDSIYQPVILGAAEFVTLKNTIVTCKEAVNMSFVNIYTGTGEEETDEPGAAEELAISVRKTVEGDDAPAKNFTFTLTQVGDEDGGAFSGAPAFSQGEMDEKAYTFGEGDYELSFDIGVLEEGTYYFMLKEQPAGANKDWEYDESEYIVRVIVDASGELAMDYRGRTGPAEPWGGWEDNSEKIAIERSKQKNVPVTPYTFDSNNNDYKLMENSYSGKNVGIESKKGLYVMDDQITNITYYPMGADANLNTPLTRREDYKYKESRDDSESALFFALRGGSRSAGLSGFEPKDLDSLLCAEMFSEAGAREGYLKCLVWIYEEYNYRNPGINLDDPESWDVKKAPLDMIAKFLSNQGVVATGDEKKRAPVEDDFKTMVRNIRGIMQQYRAGETTSLSMAYTPTGPNTGTLSFSHQGYVSSDIKGVEKYQTTLSWTPSASVLVKRTTKGGATTTLTSGSAVSKDDTITVTNNDSAPVTFTLADDAKYLKPGTIIGDLLEVTETPYDREPMLFGSAEFVTLQSTVTLKNEHAPLPFTNIYTETEEEELEEIFPEVGGSGMAPFTTGAAMLSALLSVFLAGTLIYRGYRRRKCIA